MILWSINDESGKVMNRLAIGIASISLIFIHLFIIILIFSRNNILPPRLMIQIPTDCLLDAISKFSFRQPAKFCVDFCRIDSVAAVVAFAVFYVGNEAFRLAQFLQDKLYNVDVCHFVVTTDIVSLSYGSFMDDEVDGFAVVFHIEPVTDVFAISVNRERLVIKGIGNHEGNQLFRELVGAVVVAAPGNGGGEAIGSVVSTYQEVSSRLGTAVRGRRMEWRLFREEQVRPVQGQVAVDFVCGDLVVTLDTILPASIREDRGADDIGLQENLRIQDGTIHMGLGSKVHHHIRMLLFKESIHRIPVTDIHLHKPKIRLIHDRSQSGEIPSISQLIEADNPIIRILLHHVENKVRADETGTAGYDYCHNVCCPFWSIRRRLLTANRYPPSAVRLSILSAF